MSVPAPSSHERVMICPPSDVLPQVREAQVDGATSRGRAIHEYLAAVPRLGWEAALATVPTEWRGDCEVIELGPLPASQPESFAAEVCLAYDPVRGTARVLGHDLSYEEMKALLAPNEMPAKIDTLGLTVDSVLIYDYKSGRARHGPVRTIRQLRAYALAAARAYGKSRAIVGIIRIGQDGRSWFSGGTEEDGLLDELELASVEEEIRDMIRRRDEAGRQYRAGHLPRLTVGDHCAYCPALPGCPAHMVGLRALASAGGTFAGLSTEDQEAAEKLWRDMADQAIAVATDAELARALAVTKTAKRRLEFIERTLRRRAQQAPIAREDGDVWGPREQDSVEDFDTARGTLALLYGEEVAEAAVDTKPKMSKTSIGRALRQHVLGPGGKIGLLEKDCFQALRDAGAIQPETVFRWYTPEPVPVAEAVVDAPAAAPPTNLVPVQPAVDVAASQDEIPFGR